jgi:hypothetical protein
MAQLQIDICRSTLPARRKGDHDARSALTSLEARVLLVDDVNTALAANKAVLAVASLERLERILDLHFSDPRIAGRLEFAGFPQSKTRRFGRAFRLAGM